MQHCAEFCRQFESFDHTGEFFKKFKMLIELHGGPVPEVTELLGIENQQQIWDAHALVAYATILARVKNRKSIQ